jgi:trigger factor
MQINLIKGGDCRAIVSAFVSESEYKDRVNTRLREYLTKVDIKGYRKGKVPISLIYNLYGEEIVIEEAEDICINEIDKYLLSNRMLCIGDLIRISVKKDGQGLVFEYDLNVIDYFDLSFLKELELIKYTIAPVSDIAVDDKMFDIQSNNCQTIEAAKVGEKSNVTGSIEFNNVMYEFAIYVHNADSIEQKQLLDKAIGNTVTLNMQNLLDNSAIDCLYEGDDLPDEIFDQEMIEFTIQVIRDIDFEELNEEEFLDFLRVDILPPRSELKELCRERMQYLASISARKLFCEELKKSVLRACKMELPKYYVKEKIESLWGTSGEHYENRLVSYITESIRWNLISELIIAEYKIQPADDLILEALQIAAIDKLVENFKETGVRLKDYQVEKFLDANKEDIATEGSEVLNERLVLEYIESVAIISTELISFEDLESRLSQY